MSKSRWMWISGFGLVSLLCACAEGTTVVDPQGAAAGVGGDGDGGRRSQGDGGAGDGGARTVGSTHASTSQKAASTGAAGCGDGETPCANGACIPTSARCDGIDDCAGGEDEASCGDAVSTVASTSATGVGSTSSSAAATTASSTAAATTASASASSSSGGDPCAGDFACDEGGCVSADWQCDGETDCEAGNDEDACMWTCNPDYIGDGDCDCGCGAPDPDCIDSFWDSCDYCDDSGSCAFSSCLEIDSDQNWACGP